MLDADKLLSVGQACFELGQKPEAWRLPVTDRQYTGTELGELLPLFGLHSATVEGCYVERNRHDLPPVLPTRTVQSRDGRRIHAAILPNGNVFVDSSEGSVQSTAIYQAIYAWAANNQKQVEEDPGGYSREGLFRRLSHMLSSAIRFGSTQHMLPHAGCGITDWETANTQEAVLRNIGRIAVAESRMALRKVTFLENFKYDCRTTQIAAPDRRIFSFHDGTTRIQGELDRAGADRAERVGIATACRALGVNHWTTRSDGHGGGAGLLGDVAPGILRRIRGVFYAPMR